MHVLQERVLIKCLFALTFSRRESIPTFYVHLIKSMSFAIDTRFTIFIMKKIVLVSLVTNKSHPVCRRLIVKGKNREREGRNLFTATSYS